MGCCFHFARRRDSGGGAVAGIGGGGAAEGLWRERAVAKCGHELADPSLHFTLLLSKFLNFLV